jgi:GxxExxY protein
MKRLDERRDAKAQRSDSREKIVSIKAIPYDDEEPPYAEPDSELNALATAVIGAAIEVHRHLGAGLDEQLYENAMCAEMRRRDIPFQKEIDFDVTYKGEPIGKKRIDFIVGGRLVRELKAVEALAPVHSAQLRTYLKITKCKLGLLINFNIPILKDGIKRIINSSAF